jgi:hypothetical protein
MKAHQDGCPYPASVARASAEQILGLVMLGRLNVDNEIGRAEFQQNPDLLDELRETVDQLARTVREMQRDQPAAVCHHCGRPYERTRSTGRYCSNTCRQAAYRARHAKQ